MKRDIVNSWTIKSIWYWIFSSKLEIEFFTWEIVQYLKVPKLIFEQIKESPSYFDYYKENIKWIFKSKLVEENIVC